MPSYTITTFSKDNVLYQAWAKMHSSKRSGFTLVEIMLVVTIIALLTAIAIPAFQQYRQDAQVSLLMNDLRVATDGFRAYYIKNTSYPPEAEPGVVPQGMAGYLAELDWTNQTPVGGRWDWDGVGTSTDFVAAVSINNPSISVDLMEEVDQRIDDGNLFSGSFMAFIVAGGKKGKGQGKGEIKNGSCSYCRILE